MPTVKHDLTVPFFDGEMEMRARMKKKNVCILYKKSMEARPIVIVTGYCCNWKISTHQILTESP